MTVHLSMMANCLPTGPMRTPLVLHFSNFKAERGINIIAPCKKRPNDPLRSGNCLNTGISRHCQPIEPFFHWIDAKSGIQNTSCIRFLQGLLFYVFASLAFIAISLFFYYWFAFHNGQLPSGFSSTDNLYLTLLKIYYIKESCNMAEMNPQRE